MEDYNVLGKIGAGAQGVVYRVEHKKSQQQFAMKIICCSEQSQANHAVQEVKALLQFGHPNIVSYVDFLLIFHSPREKWEFARESERTGVARYDAGVGHKETDSLRLCSVTEDAAFRGSSVGGRAPPQVMPWLSENEIAVCLVMELCASGDMQSLIKQSRLTFADTGKHSVSEGQVIAWMRQCAYALDYIHAHGFVHRDVKPTNVFFDAARSVKIGDFGLATASDPDKRSAVGSPYYSAPEQKLGQPYDARVDVWGLGVVILELVTLRDVPLNSRVIENPQCLDDLVVRPVLAMGFSAALAQLLKSMLQRLPGDRPTAAELLARLERHGASLLPSSLSLTQLSSDAGAAVCDVCEVEPATVVCHVCRAAYCAVCDGARHRHASRQTHERAPLSSAQVTLSSLGTAAPPSTLRSPLCSAPPSVVAAARRPSRELSHLSCFSPKAPQSPSFDASSCGRTYSRLYPGAATAMTGVSFSSATVSDGSQQSFTSVGRQVFASGVSGVTEAATVVRVPADFPDLGAALDAATRMPHVRQIVVSAQVVTDRPLRLTGALPEGIRVSGEEGGATTPVIEVLNCPFAVDCTSGSGVLENFVIRHMGTRGGSRAQAGSPGLRELAPNASADTSASAKKPPRPSAVVIAAGAGWRLHKCRVSCVDGTGVCVRGRKRHGDVSLLLDDDSEPAAATAAVTKCTFVDVTTAGVVLEERATGLFEGNSFEGCGYAAFLLRKDSTPTVRGNRITDGSDTGVFCQDSQGTVEQNLIAKNGGCGVVVKGRGATTIFRRNRVLSNQHAGFFICDYASPFIAENEVKQNRKAGILVKDQASPKIIKNSIEDSKEAGIYLFDHGMGIIEENRIRGNSNAGVLVTTGSAPHVIKNVISMNTYEGLWVCKGGSGTYSQNDLRGNLKGPMDLAADSQVIATNNRLED